MVYKSRVISLEKYFNVLQKEYVCTLIRHHIYPNKHDRDHFVRVMTKKEAKINNISEKESLASIFTDTSVFSTIYSEIVGEYGFPNFIYNERIQPDEVKKHYRFPYSGTLVFVQDQNKVGLTDYYDFDKREVYVRFSEGLQSQAFEHNGVHRLTLEQSDKYYFYSKGDFIKEGIDTILTSVGYDYKTGIVELFDGNESLYSSKGDDIRRILHIEMT